jgi:hypothetical protein
MARTNLAQPIDGALSTRGRGEFGSAGIARSGNRGAVVVADANGATSVSQPWSDGSWTPTSKHNGTGVAQTRRAGEMMPGLGMDLSTLMQPKTLAIAAAVGAALFFLTKKK